jgi:hypothetical protein
MDAEKQIRTVARLSVRVEQSDCNQLWKAKVQGMWCKRPNR